MEQMVTCLGIESCEALGDICMLLITYYVDSSPAPLAYAGIPLRPVDYRGPPPLPDTMYSTKDWKVPLSSPLLRHGRDD